jgi:hypothetical protein
MEFKELLETALIALEKLEKRYKSEQEAGLILEFEIKQIILDKNGIKIDASFIPISRIQSVNLTDVKIEV